MTALLLGTELTFAQTAERPAGSGSSGSPYLIANLNNLYWITQNSSEWRSTKYYRQTADIDASATSSWDGGQGFSPIGNSSRQFQGHYDGDGHSIQNLTISRSTTNYIGLFGYTDGAEIQNLGVRNASITGDYYTGGLVGQNEKSDVLNCHSTGMILGGRYTGGLVGYNYDDATVENSYSHAFTSGFRYVGGLVGVNGESSTVEDCYSTGEVSGTQNIGGLVGRNSSSTITTSYWDTETSTQTSSDGGEGKSTVEMMQQATFSGWNFATVWRIDEGNSYPEQQWQPTTTEKNGPSNTTDMDLILRIVAAQGTLPTISFIDSAPSNPTSGNFPIGINHVSGYYWIINASGLTSFSEATISVPIEDLVGVHDANTLVWLKRSNAGDDWENIGGNVSSGNLVSNAFNSFSEFAIGTTSGDNPLPVEIASFTGTSANAGIVLNWTTATETDNKGFTIYRNETIIASYSTNAELVGHRTKSSATNYVFTDADVILGESYTYTLVSEDVSGVRHEYINEVTVQVVESGATEVEPTAYALEQNYPNPFNPSTTIAFSLKQAGKVTFRVFDILGREIYKQVLNGKAGDNKPITFKGEGLNSGVYFYQISANGYTETKKMMLLK